MARSTRAVARGEGTGWIWRWDGDIAYCALANDGQGGHDLVYPMGKPHDLSLIWRLPLHLE